MQDGTPRVRITPPSHALKRKTKTGKGMTRAELVKNSSEAIGRFEKYAHGSLVSALDELLIRCSDGSGTVGTGAPDLDGTKAIAWKVRQLADAFGYLQLAQLCDVMTAIRAGPGARPEHLPAFLQAWSATLQMHAVQVRLRQAQSLDQATYATILAGLKAAARKIEEA